MEWTEENCLRLIETYKRFPVLWDPKDQYYYRKNLKNDAWKEIGAIMGSDYEQCRSKLLSLLSSFRREKGKSQKSKGTGKGASETYKSRWFAYDAFSFLADRDKPRKRLNTEQADTEQDKVDEEQVQDDGINTDTESNLSFIEPPPPKKKKSTDDKIVTEALQVLKTATEKLSDNSKLSQEVHSFINFIGAKMESYSRLTKNMVQKAIFDVIMKADSGYYNYQPDVQGYTTYSQSASTSRPHSQESNYSTEDTNDSLDDLFQY
ncbi:uncharacterized protein [Maniola hyperantus]|uniref:uncharacterized protein n=1 Tax=Aphantopus hyperantus TaxID=2795564 RepID=UPI003747ACFC